MRNIKLLSILLCIILLAGCGSNYDKGYNDGWEADKNKILYSLSKSYRNGYEDGWHACDMFNKGYHDAQHGYSPNLEYKDDENYIWGYKEGGGEYYD